jgi:hypothetical protein
MPGVEFEGLGFEVAEGDGFVVVGRVDALEGTDGLGCGVVVVEVVGSGAVLGLGEVKQGKDREEMEENHFVV